MLFKSGFAFVFITSVFLAEVSVAQLVQRVQKPEHELIEAFQNKRISKQEAISKARTLIHEHAHEHGENVKCGTALLTGLDIEDADVLFKTTSTSTLKSGKNETPAVSEIYLSPSGKFQLDFLRTGSDSVRTTDTNNNSIPDYIERAAIELDKIWQFQVVELGYRDPLVGISPYPIRFRNIGSGTYGYTLASGKSITIHSTFRNFPRNTDPEGHVIGALKATLAHEFKHAIQFRYNNFSTNSHLWAEMDATLMEEVNYDEVNDYYNYLRNTGSLFSNPETSVVSGSYEDITFALYFNQVYGNAFWPSVWQRIGNGVLQFTTALDQELQSRGTSLKEAYQEVVAWHVFSGGRRIQGYGFEEAAVYPTAKLQTILQGNLTQLQSAQSVNSLAYHVIGIIRNNAQGFVNVGVYARGKAQTFRVMSKTNPNFGELNHAEGFAFNAFKTQETWNSFDTLFVLIPNSEVAYAPFEYRVFINNESNSGFYTWGDFDVSGALNRMDVRSQIQALVNGTSINALAYLYSDISQNGILTGFDAAKSLEIVNGKKAFFDVDENQNGNGPDNALFRLPIAKSLTQSDSVFIALNPLNTVQEDARLQVALDYAQTQFAQSIYLRMPFDTLNLSLIDVALDAALSGTEFAFSQKDAALHVLLVADDVIPSGPIFTFRFNRKTPITSTLFAFDSVSVNEIVSLPYASKSLTTELPTKLGVFAESEFSDDPKSTFRLFPAYPNPFNPETQIRFSNSKPQTVELVVYTVLGQRVRVLKNEFLGAGEHQMRFNAKDLASGMYLIRLVSQSGEVATQKILLMK